MPRHAVSAILCLLFVAVFCGLPVQAVRAQEITLALSLPDARAVAQTPFEVRYEARWHGPADAFVVIPADPEFVSWGSGRLVDTVAHAEGDEQIVEFALEYVANAAGNVTVPPYALNYFERDGLEVPGTLGADTEAAPMTLRVDGFEVRVQRKNGLGEVATVVAALLVMLAGAVFALRRARAKRNADTGSGIASIPATVQVALNAARQHRLDGKLYEFYRDLSRGAALLAPSVAARALREKLERDAERVGYGAIDPTDDDLEGALRDVERALKEQLHQEQRG